LTQEKNLNRLITSGLGSLKNIRNSKVILKKRLFRATEVRSETGHGLSFIRRRADSLTFPGLAGDLPGRLAQKSDMSVCSPEKI
jgi:hypothetical protein